MLKSYASAALNSGPFREVYGLQSRNRCQDSTRATSFVMSA